MTFPQPADEEARLAALRGYHILDTLPEEDYDDIVRLAAFLCDTPVAAVTLIDADRQWFKAAVGLGIPGTPRDVAFCSHTILQYDLLSVEDAAQDARFRDNPFVTGDPHIRFYAGMPLVMDDGHALGSLCVIDVKPRRLTPEQESALRTLARQAARLIERGRALAEHERTLARAGQLQAVGSALGGALTTADVARVILDAALPIFGAGMGLVAILSGDGETLHTAGVAGVPPALSDPWKSFSVRADVPLAEAVRQRRLVVSVVSPPLQGAHPALEGSLVAVPLLVGERCVGGLGLTCPAQNCRDEEQQTFLWTLAGQCALALERARLYDEARREAEERRRAEEAARRSEEQLIEAQQVAHVGSWELDLRTGARAWSAELYHICGLDPAQGPPDEEMDQRCYHPDDLPLRDRALKELLATGRSDGIDVSAVRPDGEIRWVHLTGRAVSDDQGRAVRLVGTAADITERVEREQRVRDANTLLEVQAAQLRAANAELAALATTDPLTGLLNHRAFQARLAEEAALAEREDAPLALVILDLNNFRFFNNVHGHAVGDGALRLVAERLRAVGGPDDVSARYGGDRFALILRGAGRAPRREIEARVHAWMDGLTFQPPNEASAIPITVSVGVAVYPSGGVTLPEAVGRADERMRRAKARGTGETEANQVRTAMLNTLAGFGMMDALVAAVDNKDRYTRRHSEDVMDYSLMIARGLGLSREEQHTVAVSALLHDVGKIGVPDHILRKPGRLTDEEFEAVKQHPQMGAIIVQAIPGLEQTLDAVRHHHERWDGEGYPFGLRGEETPLIARLMAVADAYSAMTTDRPYRKGMDRAKACAILADGAGTQWDPVCVQIFLAAVK